MRLMIVLVSCLLGVVLSFGCSIKQSRLDASLLHALQLYDEGQWEESLTYCEGLIRTGHAKDDYRFYMLMGDSQSQLIKFPSAVTSYEKGLLLLQRNERTLVGARYEMMVMEQKLASVRENRKWDRHEIFRNIRASVRNADQASPPSGS
jgi:hypothetical protein